MANQFLGELTRQINGQQYILRLDFNTLCTLEEVTGRNAMDVLDTIEKGKPMLSHLRGFAFAALRHNHPEVTMLQAGALVPDLIKDKNDSAFAQLIKRSFPQDDEVEEPVGNPPAAKQG